MKTFNTVCSKWHVEFDFSIVGRIFADNAVMYHLLDTCTEEQIGTSPGQCNWPGAYPGFYTGGAPQHKLRGCTSFWKKVDLF